MIRPALTETVAAMGRALRSAQVEPTTLRSILLVGGSSRIPLVSEMLPREFTVPTALDTHPKHDVALGSVRVGRDEADVVTAPRTPVPPPESMSPEPSKGDRRPAQTACDAPAIGEMPLAGEAPTARQPTAAVFDRSDPWLPGAAADPARAVRPSASAPGGVARGPGSAGSPPPVESAGAAAMPRAGAAGPPGAAEAPPPAAEPGGGARPDQVTTGPGHPTLGDRARAR